MFICNHCPFVIHLQEVIVHLAKQYQNQGINFVAVSSNDADSYPQDGPDKMKQLAREYGYEFPYLYDETQEVARAYGAVCTPDVFVFDGDLQSVYRGQIDDSRPGNGLPVTGADLGLILDALLGEFAYPEAIKPSVGCSIKWK